MALNESTATAQLQMACRRLGYRVLMGVYVDLCVVTAWDMPRDRQAVRWVSALLSRTLYKSVQKLQLAARSSGHAATGSGTPNCAGTLLRIVLFFWFGPSVQPWLHPILESQKV